MQVNKKSKCQKVLEALEVAGYKGVHSFDLMRVGGTRCAARIDYLKKKGYDIYSVIEKKNGSIGCRYFLAPEE